MLSRDFLTFAEAFAWSTIGIGFGAFAGIGAWLATQVVR